MLCPPAEVTEFQDALRRTGSYRTDPSRPREALDRLFGRFDAWYYLRLGGLIVAGNRLAQRGEFSEATWAAHSLSFLRLLEGIGARLDISGLEHPGALGRPAVYVGNHMSALETFLLPGLLLHLGRPTAVIKDSLLTYPFLGAFARATEPISVGRTNPRSDLKAVLDQGRRSLEGGRSVVLFPQATRSAVFDPEAFNSLGVKLARSAGAPVVPLALKTDLQANGGLVKDIGPLDRAKTVRFRFGPALAVEGAGTEANEAVVRFIQACLAEWEPGRA
ncbi:MAG: 1-acyl-sn-glycerol-3-phosphate acyltransferase [Elusimicrobia bacterium]|nr:1-acyl-sn-glycerol-3-phosphate acyltransferase [Elusimicrobiota bacterium]